jgi:hypothetical protein
MLMAEEVMDHEDAHCWNGCSLQYRHDCARHGPLRYGQHHVAMIFVSPSLPPQERAVGMLTS